MRTNTNLTNSTRRAIRKYGERNCLMAWYANEVHGEGARTISYSFDTNTNGADAMINAGRELVTGRR